MRQIRMTNMLIAGFVWLLVSATVQAAESTGRFLQPTSGATVPGNLLLAVQAQDDDGVARVHISFGQNSRVLELCQSVQQCNGTSFRLTKPNIDPESYGVTAGELQLRLWVTDTGGISSVVATSIVQWQPVGQSPLTVVRSVDGTTLDLSWSGDPAVLRYNVYLASAAGVNRSTYRQLPDGQAKLALRNPQANFSGLDPLKSYYVQATSISGRGESAVTAELLIPSGLAPNQSPLAVDDSYSGLIDQPLIVTADQGLLLNDSDPDADAIFVETTSVNAPEFGTLLLQADGAFSYTPATGFTGDDSFVYRIQDGKGGTAQAKVTIKINNLISHINGGSLTISGQFLYIGQGETAPGSSIGTGLYRIGDCVQIVDTRCTMLGRYAEAVDSGHEPGQQGNYSFVMTYSGTGNSPVLARSVSPMSNSLQFVSTGSAKFELTLFPDSGGKFSGIFPAIPFTDSLNFGAFISPGVSCSGLPVTFGCTIGQVGQVTDAVLSAPLNLLNFTIPGSALNNPGPFPAEANSDLYEGAINTPLNIPAPGVLANDLEAKGVIQGNQLEIRSSYSPGLGSLVGAAGNEYQQALYFYPAFGSAIHLYNRLGTALGTLPMQGEGANDVDLDVAAAAFQLKDTLIPQGSLLIFNGETGITEVYAVNPSTGALLAQLDTAFGASHVVGGAYNPVTNSLWLLQDNVPDVGLGNLVAQIDPVTGQVISTFNLITSDHSFNVSYGDLHINPHNGNLLLVSSIQSTMAEFDVTGKLLRLIPLPAGVSAISGLAVSGDGTQLWMVATSGAVFELGYANKGAVPTLKATLLTGPANGSLVLRADGSFSYTPNTGFTGQDSFTYQVTGAFGGSSQNTVLIDVL